MNPPLRPGQWLILGFIGLWLAVQVLVPLRHLLYPGNVSWTEEGHRFAWMMKLRDKGARAVFYVRNPATQQEWQVRPRRYLVRHQVNEMQARPDMVLQYAHYLAQVWEKERGIKGVEVRAHVCASLNGRDAALLIDPQRDLVKVERNLRHADWIVPLDKPFKRPDSRTGPDELRC